MPIDSNDLPAGVAEWVNTYLSAQHSILDAQTVYFDSSNYVPLLIGSENPSVTGYQLFALEQTEATYSLYAWNESHGWNPLLENMVCTMHTDAFAAACGFTKCSDPSFDMLALTLEDGNEERVSIEPDTPFLYLYLAD